MTDEKIKTTDKLKKKDAPENLKKAKRSTENEVRNRIHDVMDLLFQRTKRYKILESIIDKYKVSRPQVDIYIKEAKKKIIKLCNDIDIVAYETAILKRQDIIDRAKAKGDLIIELKAEDSIAKLQGLFTENVRLTGDKENPIAIDVTNLSKEELEMLQEVQRIFKEKGSKNE